MHKSFLIAALAAVPLASAAAEPPTAAATSGSTPAAVAPRIPQAKLDRIRQALVAQIAVWEQSESAMREPTSAEAAALAGPPSESLGTVVPLKRGGVALQPDISQASLAIATVGDDGKVKIGHDKAAAAVPANVKRGDRHAH